MPRQQFGLCLHDFRKLFFQPSSYPSMQLLALAAQERAVGGILYQGVLEGVLRIGRPTAPENQLCPDKLVECIIYLLSRDRRDGADQLMRELTSERASDLRNLAQRRQA